MKKTWAPWLMMLFLALQFTAVATDAHQLSLSHGDSPSEAHIIEEDAGAPAGVSDSSGEQSSSHDHCPHCCHCQWHAVAAIPVMNRQRIGSTIPPYRIAFHSQHPSSFFRPPRLG